MTTTVGWDETLPLDNLVRNLVASDPRIEAIVLVGSAAVGRMTTTSDFDLAIIGKSVGSANASGKAIAGRRVEFQYFESVWVCGLRCCPFLDLQSLREAGRLATGKVLFCRSTRVLAAIRNAAKTILSPLEVTVLLGGFASQLLEARTGGFAGWIASVRALMTASILALSLSPCRYQKPKWLLRDLRRYGPSALELLWERLLAHGSREAALAFCANAHALAQLTCQLALLPPLIRADGVPDAYVNLRDLVRDSDAFIEAGVVTEACVVSAIALTHCETLLLETTSDSRCQIERSERWVREATDRLGCAVLSTSVLDCFLEDLQSAVAEVERGYWRAAGALHKNLGDASLLPLERSALLGVVRVAPRVWVGTYQSDLEVLKALGVTKLVCSAAEIQVRPARDDSVHVLELPLQDGPLHRNTRAEIRSLLAVLVKLDGVPGNLLITCNHGHNRSALIAALFLIAQGWTAPRAVRRIRQCCRKALNNPHFVALVRTSEELLSPSTQINDSFRL